MLKSVVWSVHLYLLPTRINACVCLSVNVGKTKEKGTFVTFVAFAQVTNSVCSLFNC